MQGIPGILESMKVVQVHSLGGALNAVIHRLFDEYRESFDKTRWVLFQSVRGKSVEKYGCSRSKMVRLILTRLSRESSDLVPNSFGIVSIYPLEAFHILLSTLWC